MWCKLKDISEDKRTHQSFVLEWKHYISDGLIKMFTGLKSLVRMSKSMLQNMYSQHIICSILLAILF